MQIEPAKKDSDQLFQLAVNASPTGMILVDSDGIIVLVNKKTEQIFGYEPSELLGKPIHLLVPESFRAQHAAYIKNYQKNPATRAMGEENANLLGLKKDATEFHDV